MVPGTSFSPGSKSAQPHRNMLSRDGWRFVTQISHLFRYLVTSRGCLSLPPPVNFEFQLLTNNILQQNILLSDFGTQLPFRTQTHLPQVKKMFVPVFCNWALMTEAFPLCGHIISQLCSLLCLSYN